MYSFIYHTILTPILFCHLCCISWVLIVTVVAMHRASADSQGSELLAKGCSHYLVVLLQWGRLCDGSWVLYKQKDSLSLEEPTVRQPVHLTPNCNVCLILLSESHSFVLP